jgi:hypothetical protein
VTGVINFSFIYFPVNTAAAYTRSGYFNFLNTLEIHEYQFKFMAQRAHHFFNVCGE